MENLKGSILIKGGKVVTMAGKVLECGDVLIESGKIMDIGENIDAKCEIIDATGMYVVPGFIESHSHIGIEEINGENSGNLNELSSPKTPYINALDGINFYDKSFKNALKSGITTIATGPGSGNIIGGTFSILKTFGKSPFDMIFKWKSSMKCSLGENPRRLHNSIKSSPVTKMGIAYEIRDILNKTIIYRNRKRKAAEKKESFDENIMLEEMIPVIEGKLPLSIHVHRADDIITAMRIGDEYNLKIQLVHVTDGIKLKEEIKDREIETIVGPFLSTPKRVETREKTPKIAKEFRDLNITVSVTTDHPVTPIEYLPISAALCMREGMDFISAMETITINPAIILGIDRRVGSIEVGKDGDIVITDGNPLDILSRVKYVLGSGEIVYKD